MASNNYLLLPDPGIQFRVSDPDDSGKPSISFSTFASMVEICTERYLTQLSWLEWLE